MNNASITEAATGVSRWPWAAGSSHCMIIAEIGLAHEGSLGMAQAYIEAAADAGAHAVKFQTHIAAFESTPQERFRVRMSGQDQTRYEYWQRTSFEEDEWRSLVELAHARGLLFISSPFSIEATDLLVRVGADALKIASGEVSNLPMVRHAAKSGLPVLISSGLSTIDEIDAAVEVSKDAGAAVGVFQCTSSYPCPPESIGLNLVAELGERYRCPSGLSDHSGTIYAGLAAAAGGCKLIEVHVCFSKQMYGPDVKASLTLPDLKSLVEGVAFIERANANPVDKNKVAQGFGEMRGLFTRSVVARTAIRAGSLLTAEMLALKKPGTGIPAGRMDEIVGRRILRDVDRDHLLSFDDVSKE